MIKIKNQWTGKVIATSDEGETLRDAVVRLVANRADLRDADLRDADLRGADLSGADLRGADLSGADLSGANLSDADLSDADLRDANLSGANLSGANLSDANLRDADLSDANLSGADLSGAHKEGAIQGELTPEEYAQQAIEYRERWPEVPVVPLLDATVCKLVNSGEGKLEMNTWHTCETAHCRAGWAIHLAGERGYALEAKYGSERAGAMIYKASTGRYPDFFADNETALADICFWGGIEEARQAERA